MSKNTNAKCERPEIVRDRTMENKLMHISNDKKINYSFCISIKLMEKFRHTATLPQPINMFKKSLKKIQQI